MLLGAAIWAVGRIMLVTAGVLGVGVYFSRRATGRAITTRRTIRLSQAHELHVVEVDGQRLLVGTGPGTAPSLLRVLEPPGDSENARHTSASSWEGRELP